MFQLGQPAAMFYSDDINTEFEHIQARGGEVVMPPTEVPGSIITRVKDGCNGLIQITQLRWQGMRPVSEAAAETLSVVIEREVAFPPERIWRALTQPHLIEEWLMKSDFKPVVGHRFNMRRKPKPDFDVVVDCEVLEIEPQRTLAYTWKAFDIDGVVTWTLTPTPGGTHLRMEQSAFGQTRSGLGRRQGWTWPKAFEELEQVLARME